MKLYDTLSKRKKQFRHPKKKTLRLFVCGPTVYDYSHVGHARTYVIFDMFVKYLRTKDYKVNYLQNITDIDDKIIQRAFKEKKRPNEIAKRFEEEYFSDMESLKVTAVDKYARASEYIDEIINQIKKLIKKGYAYQTSKGVYFRVHKFKRYGKLSRQKVEDVEEAVDIEADVEKENPHDFAVWKASKEGEPKWESPWGPGRPGWHIEDTAITHKVFKSPKYEIHGGARDLIFPHHEAEIALMESAFSERPMVHYWLHTGFLQVRGEKMAKSLKNFTTIRGILKQYSAETLRIFFTTKHYRSPIDYNEKGLEEAQANLERLSEFRKHLEDIKKGAAKRDTKINKHIKSFWGHLDDDFNTPKAFSELFQLVTHINKKSGLHGSDINSVREFFNDMNEIFGVLPADVLKEDRIPKEVKNLAEKREKLRKEKKWEEADKIRDEIQNKGYEIKDTPEGPKLFKR